MKRTETVYDYRDESGVLLYQAVRLEPGFEGNKKSFLQRRPDGKGGWINSLDGVRRVLYHWPELLEADKSKPVWTVEGEKDAERLVSLGMLATTNSGGSNAQWLEEYSFALRDRKIIILPDNDEPGRKHALKVAHSLYQVGCDIKLLALPGLPEKGDVSDWLNAGHTKAELIELAKTCPKWKSEPIAEKIIAASSPTSNVTQKATSPTVVCLADVEAEEVEWLWYPYIPKRKITLLTGQEGIGKSWLTCAIVAAITNGKGLPETTSVERGNVLMLSAEDGLADTVKPRLVTAGADCTHVFAPTDKLTFDEKGLLWFSEMIAAYRPLLVVIDPLFAFTGAKIDINKANEARSISSRLATIAETLDTAILAIRHFNKAKGNGDSRAAGMSSIDWRAAARVELLVGVDPDDPSQRAIIHDKHNLSEQGKSLGFTIRDGQFFWTGESSLTAARILSMGSNEEEAQERNDAADFLREELKFGPKAASEIQREARKAGLTDYQLRGAKRQLRIQTFKRGGNFGGEKGWFWALAEGVETAEDATEGVEKNEFQRLQQNHSDKSTYDNSLAEGVENKFSQRLQPENQRLQQAREVFEL